MPRAQMGPHAAEIYKFVYYINLKLFVLVFVLGSIAFEIRMLTAIKKNVHILSRLRAITAFENSGVNSVE